MAKIEDIRHSLAHLLAAAVLKKFPKAKLGIGPVVENGFYYDFLLPRPLVPEDLKELEKTMKELVKANLPFRGKPVTPLIAKKTFKDQLFKLDLIKEFAKEKKALKIYSTGDIFSDLCRGGHVKNTKEINTNAFQLDKIAGAYWRGDEKNKQLTRIYGLAFETEKELKEFLHMREEAEKRDHKKLGATLGLFAFSPLVGSGLPLFLPKGATLLRELGEFVRAEKTKRSYSFVNIPHIAKSDLYKKSGHLGKYDAMMPLMKDADGDEFAMKAMNCPHHFEMFNAQPHSYRDLPIRYAETTTVYRNEKSGELSGLLRVKALTQDDTHHFVRHDQIGAEIEMILGLMDSVYKVFGFSDFLVQVSVRDPKDKKKYFGSDSLWKKSEDILIKAVKSWNKPYVIEKGEAAFYGPKIDIMVKDAIGRHWQLTTVQLDFNQPENFDLHYIGEDGKTHRPAVLHVAILGSLERFLGVLIEHFAGAFPTWLAPNQVRVLAVSEKQRDYAEKILSALKESGLRADLGSFEETLGKNIRQGEMEKIPYLLIVGDKEKENNTVNARSRKTQQQTEMSLVKFIESIDEEIKEKRL
ncbi:MAG: threonine--tRNA ligase [bacterium]|nr:threonine--tRNA ligase [bacterium]